jgi:hypothetical protein
MTEYAALSNTPHALADGLMLVFQHPAKARPFPFRSVPLRSRLPGKNALALIQSVSE